MSTQPSSQPNTTTTTDLAEPLDVFALPEARLLLSRDIAASPESQSDRDADILRAEYNRTLCSINVLGYLYQGKDEDYTALTTPQPKDIALTREEFNTLHQCFTTILTSEHDVNVMRYIMTIHDIGKNETVANAVTNGEAGSIDHDEALRRLFDSGFSQQRAIFLPSLELFSPEDQDVIRAVLTTDLNLGQFIQAEAPAAILNKFTEVEEPIRSLHIMHAILDIAGAAGQTDPTGSRVLTSPMYYQMMDALDAITDQRAVDSHGIYTAYLTKRARRFGVNEDIADNDQLHSTIRLACMLRYDTPEEFQRVAEAFSALTPSVQEILSYNLTRDGIHDRAILPYYGPALLKGLEKTHYSLPETLTYFAHVIQEAFIADTPARKQGQTGVVTADLSLIAKDANLGTLDPVHAELRFHHSGDTLIADYRHVPELHIDHLPVFDCETLRGKRVLYIGMGGGSDGIQAAMLSKIHQQRYGAHPAAIVSVRSDYKPLQNTGRTIGKAMFEITDQTVKLGDWRFLEHIIAKDTSIVPTYILNGIDPKDIAHDLRAFLEQNAIDAIIGVDTGGDVLYKAHADVDSIISTPDQDYAVLTALNMINRGTSNAYDTYTAIVAPGVDTPDYADEVLEASQARQIILTTGDVTTINETYATWRMDGSASEEGLYGKTPLAWLAALNGHYGLQPLALPRANGVSVYNPWRIYMNIRPSTAGVVIMPAQQLYQVVSEK